MKILYDFQAFEMQKFGGISRYFYELINYFEAGNDIEWQLPLTYSGNEYLNQLNNFKGKLQPKVTRSDSLNKFLGGSHFKGKEYLFDLKNRMVTDKSTRQTESNKLASIASLKSGDFDLFHPTFYDDYFLEHIGNKPYVLTVYDLINQVFPEFHMYDARDKSKALLDKAEKIISISHSTKSDLVNLFNVPEEKIKVIHLANSLQPKSFTVSEKFKNSIPGRYLLFVGNREGYKNFLFFSQIVAALNDRGHNLNVVCTGPAFNKSEMFFFNKLAVNDRFYHTYVNDDELTYLYKNALAFVFPSMYEGFGIPVLEAFSCGCPVLTSKTSSLLEICEDAAIYFEPKNSASMISALTSVINNEQFRQRLITKGYDQGGKFSWLATADETWKVYQQIGIAN